jgi:hypothetical protein
MPDGVLPTPACATYCPVMLPLKLEREVLLAEPSEIQTQSTHGITLPREHGSGTRVYPREDRLVGAGEQEVPAGFLCCKLSHSLVRT